MSTKILVWHFRSADGTTEYLRTPETVGETYRVTGPIEPCRTGLHGSVRAIDVLEYAPGPLVCRVEHGGEIVHHADGTKLASSERRLLWTADATKALRLFACWSAERALLRERKAGREPDSRSWNAIAVARLFAEGKASIQDLAAAWAAARAAAWDAAWDATHLATAGAAARAAAGAAAGAAARAAAWDAARAAARDAAGAAEREIQNAKLEEMLLALEPKKKPTKKRRSK